MGIVYKCLRFLALSWDDFEACTFYPALESPWEKDFRSPTWVAGPAALPAPADILSLITFLLQPLSTMATCVCNFYSYVSSLVRQYGTCICESSLLYNFFIFRLTFWIVNLCGDRFSGPFGCESHRPQLSSYHTRLGLTQTCS